MCKPIRVMKRPRAGNSHEISLRRCSLDSGPRQICSSDDDISFVYRAPPGSMPATIARRSPDIYFLLYFILDSCRTSVHLSRPYIYNATVRVKRSPESFVAWSVFKFNFETSTVFVLRSFVFFFLNGDMCVRVCIKIQLKYNLILGSILKTCDIC